MTDLSQLERTHRALLAERAAARHREQEHRRETRTRRHVAVGAVATIAVFLLVPIVDDLPTYLAMVAAVGVALGSFARAVDLRLGYTWGRLYRDPKRVSSFDRWVVRMVEGCRTNDGDDDEPRVRVLPPRG